MLRTEKGRARSNRPLRQLLRPVNTKERTDRPTDDMDSGSDTSLSDRSWGLPTPPPTARSDELDTFRFNQDADDEISALFRDVHTPEHSVRVPRISPPAIRPLNPAAIRGIDIDRAKNLVHRRIVAELDAYEVGEKGGNAHGKVKVTRRGLQGEILQMRA